MDKLFDKLDHIFEHVVKYFFWYLITALAIGVVNLFAWFTHVSHCIQHEEWVFLVAGAIAFPIACVHGWGLWFGIF